MPRFHVKFRTRTRIGLAWAGVLALLVMVRGHGSLNLESVNDGFAIYTTRGRDIVRAGSTEPEVVSLRQSVAALVQTGDEEVAAHLRAIAGSVRQGLGAIWEASLVSGLIVSHASDSEAPRLDGGAMRTGDR